MFVYHLRLGLFCYVFVRNMQLLVGYISCTLMMSLILDIYLLRLCDWMCSVTKFGNFHFETKKVNIREILVFIMCIKAIFILVTKVKIMKFKEDFEILFCIFMSHFY